MKGAEYSGVFGSAGDAPSTPPNATWPSKRDSSSRATSLEFSPPSVRQCRQDSSPEMAQLSYHPNRVLGRNTNGTSKSIDPWVALSRTASFHLFLYQSNSVCCHLVHRRLSLFHFCMFKCVCSHFSIYMTLLIGKQIKITEKVGRENVAIIR